ncbi:hypothetical protein BLS_006293 [Venturia inaequalis]|uniref:Uncharacterized protein n=1 Tax=Venturia inaequalis TaxID=5025 RepID=A0A8H3Z7E9_VENIN|nr:hypothetical protein BLS_006293 [Venturia inaequalis]
MMEPRNFGMPAYQQGGVAPGSAGKDYAGLTPLGGNVFALIISLVTQLVLVYSQRITAMADPRRAPFAIWHLPCLNLVMIKNQLYRFNIGVAIGPYLALWALTFAARLYYIDYRHICYLGIGRPILIPLIIWDLVLNIYLTALFISPLRKLYSYQTNSNPGLRNMARRTFVGCVVSLLCTIMNLAVQSILDGEQAWLCLMLCNTDVLMNVLVIHWVAHTDIERNQRKARDPDKAHLSPHNPSPRIWSKRNSKDLEKSVDDRACSLTAPSCRVGRHASVSFDSGESPWDGLTGVNTMIEAGDGSSGGSFIMEPMSIKVKTSHKWEENPAESPALGPVEVPIKALRINRSRTTTWPQKIQRNDKDDAVRNDSV